MKRTLGRLGLLAAGLLLALLLAEGLVRGLGLAPDIGFLSVNRPQGSFVAAMDDVLRYVPMPGSPGVSSQGIRDRDHDIEPEGVSVAVLGDSIGWGFCNWDGALPLEEGFPWLLEEALGVDVINLSVSGYDTRQEVRMLEVAGLQFGPDVVLVAATPNDRWPMASNEFELLRRQDGWERHRQLASLRKNVLYRFHLTRLLLVRFAPPPAPEEAMGLDSEDPVDAGFKRLKQLAVKHDFEIRVALFPDPKSPLDHLEQQVEAHGLTSLDMSTVLTDRGDHYAPCSAMHPNTEGHKLAAEALAPFVAEALPR